jgi:acetyl-CoA acetyltransferase
LVPEIKIKTTHMTRLGRSEADYLSLLLAAVGPALEGADLERIERVYLSTFAPGELCGVADPLGAVESALAGAFPALRAAFEGPFKTGGEALFRALESAGETDGDVLMVACEKMTHVDAARAAGLLAPRVNPVENLYGATLPALAALVTRAYMHDHGVPYCAFHRVAVKNHYHASLNPNAHFRSRVSVDEVAQSPLVSDPLRRHHCAPMSDGAVACVLGRGRGQVAVRGWGRGVDARLFHERARLARFPSARVASRTAFARAGVAARDVDVVEIHDAFSPFELINLEEMGFFPAGRAWRALETGELEIGGRLAVNPSGGMKARGHPIGVCGLSSLVEMHAQLTGAAGARQHRGARLGVVQSAGGVSRDGYVFVLEAA